MIIKKKHTNLLNISYVTQAPLRGNKAPKERDLYLKIPMSIFMLGLKNGQWWRSMIKESMR